MAQRANRVIGSIEVRNIGGISDQQLDLAPGVNVLVGQNATNRTSFLKALAAAQGSEAVALKGDTEAGSVELELDGDHYEREIRQVDDSLVFEGTAVVDAEHRDLAELFAFLFERNRAREAIRQGSDLRRVVMEPVDTDAIQADIERLQNRRSTKESELEELQSLRQRLPSLHDRRDELAAKIDQLEADIAQTNAEIEAQESVVDQESEQEQELEAKFSELRELESELDTVRSKISNTEETVSALESERAEAQSELEELDAVDETELAEVKSTLSGLHEQLAQKESMMSELQNIIEFNKDVVSESETEIEAALTHTDDQSGGSDESVTADLMNGTDGLVCWTCGSQTTRSQISETLERLQTVHEDLYGEREHLRSRIDEQTERKEQLVSTRDRRETLEETIADLGTQIERNRELRSQLAEQVEPLETEIEELEDEIETLREQQEDEILDLHQELTNLEVRLSETTEEHQSVCAEIDDVESEIDRIDEVEAEIEEITGQITERRQRVERIERQAIEMFNQHMDSLLDILDYSNIERIWIESRERTASERGSADQRRFELHVIREGEDGAAYEDTVGHLSESEREVTGLVFALAGYLAHEVYEVVPFMILDSLEAIDSERIARIIEYLQEYADNIAVALLE